MKIKHKSIKNQKVNLPDVGEKELVDGIVDIPEATAKLLVEKGGEHWEYVDKIKETTGKKEGKSKKVKGIEEEQELEPETIDEDPEEINDEDIDEDDYSELSVEELCDIAEQGGVSNWEKFKNKKQVLIALIKKNLK